MKAGIDTRRIGWRRVVDMNDRALRQITSSLGGIANGYPREDGFDITVASEVMAIFCLSKNLEDLQERLGRIVIGYTREREPVLSSAVMGPGPMTVLLKDAIAPNLVQTLEHNPAFVHGGPFANIAHGCNSVIATRAAMKMGGLCGNGSRFRRRSGCGKSSSTSNVARRDSNRMRWSWSRLYAHSRCTAVSARMTS